jgi:hypothetical protein
MRVALYVWRREVPNIACGNMREASQYTRSTDTSIILYPGSTIGKKAVNNISCCTIEARRSYYSISHHKTANNHYVNNVLRFVIPFSVHLFIKTQHCS